MTKWILKLLAMTMITGVLATACNGGPNGKTPPALRSSGEAIAPETSEIQLIRRGAHAMGTFFDCTVAVTGDTARAEAAIDEALLEVERVETMMSTYREESPISKVNAQSGGDPVTVPDELIDIIEQSKAISRLTSGKFDISFDAVGRLWDFKADPPRLPDPEMLRQSLSLVDDQKVEVSSVKHTVRLAEKGMRIGLGAIAKGYAVDRASAVLRSRGFENFIVYGGGDLYLSGKKGGEPWRVGIQHPRDRSLYFAKLSLERSGAVVTSGDYEKFFELDGKRYCHIIDPDTGYPSTGAISVTVVADTAMRADALATGIFALGPKRGMEIVEADSTLEAVIVDDALNTIISSGLKGRIEVEPLK